MIGATFNKKYMEKKDKVVDDLSKPIEESRAVQMFRAKCETALANISNVEKFRADDTMVDYVFKIGRELFDKPLDLMNVGNMLRTGGRLTGVYVYLGQKSARARAERDVYAQKASEMEKERMLELLHSEIKVTEARSIVAAELSELQEFVVQKDIAKNQWENITTASEKMVSFIQSAIKVKEGERFHSKQMMENAG